MGYAPPMAEEDESKIGSPARLQEILADNFPPDATQREWAKKLNITNTHVSNIVNRKANGLPSLALADAWLREVGSRLVLDTEPLDAVKRQARREDLEAMADMRPEHRRVLASYARIMRHEPDLVEALEHDLELWRKRHRSRQADDR